MSTGLSELRWYLARLRVMTGSEIVHRVAEQARIRAMQLRYLSKVPVSTRTPSSAFCESKHRCLPDLPWEFEAHEKEMRALLAGRVRVMSWSWRWRPGTSAWHTAPDTGNQWPKEFFGSIPYRPGNAYGDVRVAWEPSRLQLLVTLALLAEHADEATNAEAANVLEVMFLDWVEDNTFLHGIHYISAMECALRIMSCCHALDMVRSKLSDPAAVWDKLIQLVHEHAWLIERRLSLYSSRNNHVVCEAAGLLYAGILFPELPRARRWRALGNRLLAAEADRQILEDGGSAEQTFWYLCLVTDLFGLTSAMLRHLGERVPVSIDQAFDRGRQFLNTFAARPDDLPSIGDCDNGYALSPYLRLSWSSDDSVHANPVTTFAATGYTLVQDPESRISLIFDHGSLGLAPTYVHGHADALSVVVRSRHAGLLIDPGTFTYSGDQRWRTYFRGTAAHNTVRVDDQDQAHQETRFMWSRPYDAALLWSDVADGGRRYLVGRQDGYERSCGVIHWRGIVVIPSVTVVVLDLLTGEGTHKLELNWHLGSSNIIFNDGKWVMHGLDEPVHIRIIGGETKCLIGDETSPAGWCSRVYGTREPTCTLQSAVEAAPPFEFVTTVQIGTATKRELDTVTSELAVLRERIREAQTH